MDQCPIAHWSGLQPNRPAISSKNDTLTYAQLDLLVRELPLPETPLIPFTPAPTPEHIALFFAAWRKGVGVYPLSFRLPEREKERRLNLTGAALDTSPFSEGPALLLETSGTTGEPKIVSHTLDSLWTSGTNSAKALSLSPEDRYCLNLPLFHISGIAICLRTFLTGATLLLTDLQEEATLLSLVPTQLYRLLQARLPIRARSLLIGGAPLPPLLFEEALEKNLSLFLTYGMTETAAMATLNPMATSLHAGNPLPHIELKLAPDGEILLRGKSLLQNYLDNPKRDPSEWFPTKDLGSLSPDGDLQILGRKDRQFISGGENIQPEIIEKALLSLPGILEARVLPEPDEEFGMRPSALITTSTPLSIKTIQTLLRDSLPSFQIPKTIRMSLAD